MSDIKFILGTDVTFEQASQYIKQMVADWEKLKGSIQGSNTFTDKNAASLARNVNQLQKLAQNAEKYTRQQQLAGGIIGKQEAEVRRLRHEWKAAATQAEQLQKKAQLDKVQRQLKAAKNTTSEWAQAISSFQFKFNALGNIVANTMSRVTQMAKRALSEAVKYIIEFEQAMADVRAITGASNEEFRKLEKSARDLGGSTRYTAGEVAKLQKEFAKLGFSTQEILNASEATLALASATGSDLARAAEVAGSTVRAFNLDTTETQRIVDVMARSFTSSALDMERFSESMKYVGPIAKAMGVSVEETTAMLSALANAGIHGSQAGTALRRIFLQLAKDGRPVSVRMAELAKTGITVADAQDEMGQRAATAMVVLGDQMELVKELKGVYENAGGAAQEMADIQLDTLKGQILILKSALGEYALALNESAKATENSKGAIEGISTAVSFLAKNVEWIKVIAKGASGNIWGALTYGIFQAKEEIDSARESLAGEDGSGDDPGDGLAGDINTVTAAVVKSLMPMTQYIAMLRETKALEDEEAEGVWETWSGLTPDAVAETASVTEELEGLVSDMVDANIADYERAREARAAIHEQHKDQVLSEIDLYTQYAMQITAMSNQALAQGELSFKKFGQIVLASTLDLLQKKLLLTQAEVTLASLAQPDSVATFGASGIARAAIINALIIGAFQAAKAAVGSFAEGGYTGDGKMRDGTGERVAGVVHEKEFVINRRQTAKHRALLEDINAGRDHAVWNALNIDLNKKHTGTDYQKLTYEVLKKTKSYGETKDHYIEYHPETNTTIYIKK